MNHIGLAVLLMLGISTSYAAIKEEQVDYQAGDTTLKGYLVYDDAVEGPRPGVLVVHEWWGLNDYARNRARMLAELGYTALAVDMYGGGKTADHPDTAGQFAGEVRQNWESGKARFMAAYDLLSEHATTDGDRLAAIGYCFGGGVVLQMAREGVDLDGVVSFHGSLATDNPAEPGEVEAEILVYNGAEDPFVKPEQIEAFKQEMEAAGADYEFVNLAGAKHSFTNPGATENGQEFGLPLEYNAEADRKSWEGMQAFFEEIFAQ